MIYKVDLNSRVRSSLGYTYFRNKKDAEKYAKKNTYTTISDPDDMWIEADEFIATITAIPTPKTKREMVHLLNVHGGHNNNG